MIAGRVDKAASLGNVAESFRKLQKSSKRFQKALENFRKGFFPRVKKGIEKWFLSISLIVHVCNSKLKYSTK
jgi:hypothetical protein